MNFNEIIGQDYIVDSLISSKKSNKILHSYIFEGPKGIGKKTISKAFSNLLLCETNNDSSCGMCKSCKLFLANSHPDITIISPEKSISVEQIRDMVKDMGVKPYYGKKKICIIENAEKMTIGAQNSLLKTLEEPPEYALIILTTENINLLLSTVVSRCVIKKFSRNTKNELNDYILSNYPEEEKRSQIIISLADGIIGNVDEMLNNPEFFSLRTECINIIEKIYNGTRLEATQTSDFFIKQKDNIDLVLGIMILLLRDLLILIETNNDELVINHDYINTLKDLSKVVKQPTINNGINGVIEAKKVMNMNANFNITIEVMILKFKNYQGALA